MKKGSIKEIIIALVILVCAMAILGAITLKAASITEDESFEYTVQDDGTIEITKYTGLEAEVTIPITIDGKTVTSIGDGCFNNCTSITNITIPDTVTNIGFAAFAGCSSLVSINIPKGVTVIEKQLFDGCSSLIKVEIPEGVTEIKNYAFVGCTSLETVEIPDSVESISSRVFQYCQKLKNINIPENVNCSDEMFFQSVLQIWTTIEEGTEQEIQLPDIITRSKNEEDNLYTESEFTYLNCKISEDNTKLIINTQDLKDGNEVGIKVNEGPLEGLTVRIMLPEVTWNIAKDKNSNVKATFKYNEKLLTITGNGQMKDFGWDCGPWYYLRNYIENVVIEYGVTSIGTYCFFDNPGINNINLPETIKLIAPYAFRGCENLKTINIPEGTQVIGTGAFSACDNLNEVNISSTVFAIGLDTVTMEWDEGMLEGLTITSTGEVFKECISLKNINVNSNNKYYSSYDGILYNKSKSTLINYPAGKENEEFEIPNTVTEIYADAFDSCVYLQSIEIPGTVEEIKNQCFRASNLNNIILNEGLKTIGEYAFYENDNIEEIYIPSSVESIGEGAISKMESLRSIEVSQDNKIYTSENGILFSKDKSKLIEYPANKSGSMYTIPDMVKSIETGAFAYGNNLNYLKINDNTNKIDTSAFAFSELKGIYIPNSVETICVFNVAGDITPFYGCKDYTIYCNEESYAKDFCVQYSLNYSTNMEEIFDKFAQEVIEMISLTKIPDNTTYVGGQNFDTTGMIITVTYNDGNTEETTDYTVLNGTNLRCGEQKIIIQYNKNTEMKVEVTVHVEHLEEIDQAVEPTCTETGLTEGKHCSVCNEILVAQEVISAAHTEVTDPAVAPTCTETGLTEGKHCSVCNEVLVSQTEVPELGHDYENGKCTRCGEASPAITIISQIYNIIDKMITKISPKTKLGTLKSNIQTNASEVEIYNNNEKVEDEEKIATGMKIKFLLNGKNEEYTLVVTGDTDGDGEAGFNDILQINKHRLNKVSLANEYLKAGDVDENGKVEFNDILKINKYRLGKIDSL